MDQKDVRQRRLLWRASHRGIKEMDILLGGFAAARVHGLSEQEVDELETIVGLPDPELLSWITGASPVPPKLRTATLEALLAYRP
ncbi:MAG: succinate dehydrogenase assembly factor 2 [Hyphomicrobiales bacterium]